MSKKIWTHDDAHVYRHGVPVAEIYRADNLSLGWRGFGRERYGFDFTADIEADVKYFWRSRHKPTLSVRFKDGSRADVY